MGKNTPIDDHLESALEHADDAETRFHLRQALQLRLAESVQPEETLAP